MDKPKFGDKSIGRTSIERFIMFLEANNAIKPFVTISILVVLIGVNTYVHNDYSKGFIFLLLTAIILLSGVKPAESFFGASALAIFIAIHLSLYGFNALPLVISFAVFIIFRAIFENNLLLPISIYLIFDSLFSYINVYEVIDTYVQKIGRIVFSKEIMIFALIIPVAFVYLQVEKRINNVFNNSFWREFGTLLVMTILYYIFILIGLAFNYMILKYLGVGILLLYVIGIMLTTKNNKYLYISIIPVILFITLVWILNITKIIKI